MGCYRDFVGFSFPHTGGERDPERMRKLLEAQLKYERLRTIRRFLIAVLAVLGGLLWFGAAMSRTNRRPARGLGVGVWAVCAALAIAIAMLEYKWRRRRNALMSGEDN